MSRRHAEAAETDDDDDDDGDDEAIGTKIVSPLKA
jgi:hypothetical protein